MIAFASLLASPATAQSPTGAFLWGDGKGDAQHDCLIGLVGYADTDLQPTDRKGRHLGLVCSDGDPACDRDDRRDGVCQFRIGVFLRKSGHASCDPTTEPRRFRARAKAGVVAIDLATRLGLSNEAGMDYVSDLIPFPVALRGRTLTKAGKGTVTLRAKRPRDRDRFRFRCDWAPPPTTTTTSTSTSITSTTIVSGCYIDTGLTVIDTCNDLEWEKKDTPAASGIDAGSLHDVDNTYTWAGVCTMSTLTFCQPNTAAAATCRRQTGWAGCDECEVGDGTCDPARFEAITTIWDWLNQVNAANFAGHADWRLPSESGCDLCWNGNACTSCDHHELETLLLSPPFTCETPPCIDPILGPTVAGGYVSGSLGGLPGCSLGCFAWVVDFGSSPGVYPGHPVDPWSVRAVRFRFRP